MTYHCLKKWDELGYVTAATGLF